jgi:hypothetical protein
VECAFFAFVRSTIANRRSFGFGGLKKRNIHSMAEYEVAYQRYEYDPSPTNFVSDCTCVVVNVQSSSM